jgi:3'-phosphoadenosine 5'-phosphosulfate sulfotransferase (PAPS reductase)/FAD synthetase
MERNEEATDGRTNLEAKSARRSSPGRWSGFIPHRLRFQLRRRGRRRHRHARALRKDARIFTLDTGRLHEETYEVMEAVRTRYGVSIESYFPERASVEKLERGEGASTPSARASRTARSAARPQGGAAQRALSGSTPGSAACAATRR